MNGRFAQEQTAVKNRAMTELRTKQPDASAAKIRVWASQNFENVAAAQHDFPEPDIQGREAG